MVSAAHLMASRSLNIELKKRGYRPFSYPRLCAMVARGIVPSYTDVTRTVRGGLVRLFDVDEVIAAIESRVRRAA